MGIGVAESGGVHSASTAARSMAETGEATEKNAARRITGTLRLLLMFVMFIPLPFLR